MPPVPALPKEIQFTVVPQLLEKLPDFRVHVLIFGVTGLDECLSLSDHLGKGEAVSAGIGKPQQSPKKFLLGHRLAPYQEYTFS